MFYTKVHEMLYFAKSLKRNSVMFKKVSFAQNLKQSHIILRIIIYTSQIFLDILVSRYNI